MEKYDNISRPFFDKEAAIIKALDQLSKVTYVVEHNPNCPSPFLVRLVGPRSGRIDKKHYNETEDILGFGKTLKEAAEAAFLKEHHHELCERIADKFGWSMGVTWQKIDKVRSILSKQTIEHTIKFLLSPSVNKSNRLLAD